MFCAMTTVIERCKTEGVVDVFQAVKALRVQKPGAVPTIVSTLALCERSQVQIHGEKTFFKRGCMI